MNITEKKRIVINFILFDIGWMICVISGANQLGMVALITVFVFMMYHFYVIPDKLTEFKFIAIAAILGTLVDSINLYLGILNHLDPNQIPIAPLWLIALWILFASTIRHSFSWLNHKPLMAAISGAIFGPLAYYSGYKLGALNLASDNIAYSIISISVIWAILTPGLFLISRLLNTSTKFRNSSRYLAN